MSKLQDSIILARNKSKLLDNIILARNRSKLLDKIILKDVLQQFGMLGL